jgi:hypothetical protein
MKQLLLFSVLGMGLIPATDSLTVENKFSSPASIAVPAAAKSISFGSQQAGNEKMPANVFRAQDFCYIELKDFEWKVEFDLVSATVYFSGANFSRVEKGVITSKSLQPVKKYMDRCVPGTMVIFDNVKVLGPDKTVRGIRGLSLVLH